MRGKFNKNYNVAFHVVNPPDTNRIIANEQADRASREIRPFRFAEPINVKIDLKEKINWLEDSSYLHGRLDLKVKNAKSLSLNYGKFYLPDGASMYIYNRNGEMITGPVTSSENNEAQLWGSSVYKGDLVTIEIRVPKASFGQLKLIVDNIAYGYKKVFDQAGFGESSTCNINVLCPLGNGWGQERNSVTLILNQNGSRWCSGALINNTCNINIPYLLTANHCLNSGAEDVTKWRFMFPVLESTMRPFSR